MSPSPLPEEPNSEDEEPPEPAHTRRMGVWMMAAAWVLVLGLLAVPFAEMLERQLNPNQEVSAAQLADGSREVRLERNRAGHYVASGAINRRPVTFLVDTGATVVSVPQGLAREIGLERGAPVRLRTANGQVTAFATRLDAVQLGNITLRDVSAVINPGHGTDEVLLGMSFLKQLELTQRGRELTLRQLR